MLLIEILAIIWSYGTLSASGSTFPANNTELQLLQYLFTNYSPEVRPVKNNWDPVTVKLGIMLKQIIDVDERNQLITTNVWIRQYWKNHLLVWDPAKFGGVKSMNIDPKRVWIPDILLYNPASMDQKVGSLYKKIDTKVILSHTGQITWLSPAIIKTECKIDVSNFPFDEQTCPLQFGSWTYNGLKIDIQLNQANGMDTEKYSPNMEWHLVKVPGVREVITYNCCPEPYPSLTFTIIIQRRAMFFLYNLIIPCTMIALLSLCSFYLPPESGERVGFVITVLLAMSVFMLMVTENMPQSAEVPLASKFFMAAMAQIALSLATTCIVIKYSHSKDPIKPIVALVVNNWLAKLLLLKPWKMDTSPIRPAFTKCKLPTVITNFDGKLDDGERKAVEALPTTDQLEEVCKDINQEKNTKNSEMEKLISEVKVLSDKIRQEAEEQNHQDDWVFAALVLDRFFLVSFSVTLIFTCFGVLIQIPSNSTVY